MLVEVLVEVLVALSSTFVSFCTSKLSSGEVQDHIKCELIGGGCLISILTLSCYYY